MAEPFLGEIRIVSFGFAPKGWALCDGQLMPINQNQALFSILGTTYGGDGKLTFALPNLQGGIPVHDGNGFVLGQSGGETEHALTVSEMPAHRHTVVAGTIPPSVSSPAGAFGASLTGFYPYSAMADGSLSPSALAPSGAGQPHNNLSPYLVLNFVIALQGIFPSRN
jgi:microcystin-dependent protein